MTHTSEKTESLRRYDQYTSITLTDVRDKMTVREKKGEERETDRQREREVKRIERNIHINRHITEKGNADQNLNC